VVSCESSNEASSSITYKDFLDELSSSGSSRSSGSSSSSSSGGSSRSSGSSSNINITSQTFLLCLNFRRHPHLALICRKILRRKCDERQKSRF
jgi:hypothetical protein